MCPWYGIKTAKKNKETRLTRSMTVLTNSSASLGTQVCLLLALQIHSLMASKTFFFQMAGSQYHLLYPALLSDRLTSKLGWLCSRINLCQQTVQCAITGRTHMYYHIFRTLLTLILKLHLNPQIALWKKSAKMSSIFQNVLTLYAHTYEPLNVTIRAEGTTAWTISNMSNKEIKQHLDVFESIFLCQSLVKETFLCKPT